MVDLASLEEYQIIMARLTPERRVEFARWAADLAQQFADYASQLGPMMSPDTTPPD